MQLSVVILNYNVRYFLEQCVRSVQKALQNIDSEIIVIDNHSADDSCPMIKELFPNVILIENQDNTGFPKGNNIGVARAKGKYLCILNPDTVVSEDTFSKLLDFAQNNTNLGIVGCKLIDGTGNFLPESKRNVPTPLVSLKKLLGKTDKYYANHLSENQSGKADIFVGAFMFIEREKYLHLGGFDEEFFMYGEDIDLSYRALKNGFENYYFADTAIIHYKGESTGKDNVYIKRFYSAMQIFYKKHFKTNVFFDGIITIGIRAFTLLNSVRKNKSVVISPEAYLLISQSEELQSKLERTLDKPIEQVNSFKNLNFNTLKTEIIFDGDYLTNREIISFIQQNRNKGFTFKIKPTGTNFIIGSNSKDDKGKVIVITD